MIANRVTDHRAEIGNRCVKRFLGLRSDRIFAAIKRIRKDITRSLNADAIVFFHERSLINAWEYNFLQDTLNKRVLSPAQEATRLKLNRKVLEAVSRKGLQRPDS